MTWLLDVNVLISLIDPTHVLHEAAHRWFSGLDGEPWATCPMTENAVMRIVGHPKYPNSAGSPAAVAPIVQGLRVLAGHAFWPDDFSLVASERVDPGAIETPGQVTDTYLLALAVSKGGRLATFDRRLSIRAVRGGRNGLHVIAGPA
jgi:toxin-antitoxin system PIN domain toxin